MMLFVACFAKKQQSEMKQFEVLRSKMQSWLTFHVYFKIALSPSLLNDNFQILYIDWDMEYKCRSPNPSIAQSDFLALTAFVVDLILQRKRLHVASLLVSITKLAFWIPQHK